MIARAICALLALTLTGCGGMGGQQALSQTTADVQSCMRAVRASPEGRVVYARLLAGQDDTSAAKLSDPKPLTKPERDALMAVHAKAVRCRQPVIDYDTRYAAWELPYWQAYFAKLDAITYKLAAGDITVGEGNKSYLQAEG